MRLTPVVYATGDTVRRLRDNRIGDVKTVDEGRLYVHWRGDKHGRWVYKADVKPDDAFSIRVPNDSVDGFRIGDDVVYVGYADGLRGKRGVIMDIIVDSNSSTTWLDVKWEYSAGHLQSNWRDKANNFRHSLRIGDHVQYIRRSDGQPSDNFSHGIVEDFIFDLGKAKVAWLGVPFQKWFDPELNQLRRLEMLPTQAEIDKALATLRAAGKVEFKPHRPSFIPQQVRLNDEYTALVANPENRKVKVGCQEFTFEAIKQLHNAVQSAETYNMKYGT